MPRQQIFLPLDNMYNICISCDMEIEFDPQKAKDNLRKHDVKQGGKEMYYA